VKISRLIFSSLFLAAILVCSCGNNNSTKESNSQELTGDQLIQRGDYLVATLGCNDCHSPKRMGTKGPEIIPELMLSGYPADRTLAPIDSDALHNGWLLFPLDLTAAVGPWGVSFAANLTSDPTGIGNWPEENFARALRQGKFKGLEGTRTLLPTMPWENYAKLTDADIKAIYAYLKSTKPVHNVVPAAIIAQ
jgi:mono/diheme cytochrome c family protein